MAGKSAEVRAEPAEGSIEALRQDEAQAAMNAGQFERARHLYQVVLASQPDNAWAHREVGRASHALGQLDFAARELRRADELAHGAPDPELHYLLGEALFATGRTAEARREYQRAEREIGETPVDRMAQLWLARIRARLGDAAGAERIYAAMLAANPEDDEVAFAQIETRIFVRDWAGAEKLLRGFLARRPGHPHARETLAWVLEAEGKADEESALRGRLADEVGDGDFAHTYDLARSLERAGDLEGALDRYRAALAIDPQGDPAVAAAVERLGHRLSPEASAGMVVRRDPSGTVTEWRAGMSLPIRSIHALAVSASYDTSSSGTDMTGADTGTMSAALLLGRDRLVSSVLTVSGNFRSVATTGTERTDTFDVGSAGELRVGTGHRVQLHARADFHMPWREAANTIREGGSYDGLTAHLYALPFGNRLVIDSGAWVRRMELSPLMDSGEVPRGRQALAFAGADLVAWVNPLNTARGQILDEDMLWPTYLADAVVISFRHYEAWTDPEFLDRLVVAERNQIDELGGTARQVLFQGALAIEARTAAGYDMARDVTMWRAGGALLVSPSTSTRLTLSYDLASESATGFVGRRHAGWITLHADL